MFRNIALMIRRKDLHAVHAGEKSQGYIAREWPTTRRQYRDAAQSLTEAFSLSAGLSIAPHVPDIPFTRLQLQSYFDVTRKMGYDGEMRFLHWIPGGLTANDLVALGMFVQDQRLISYLERDGLTTTGMWVLAIPGMLRDMSGRTARTQAHYVHEYSAVLNVPKSVLTLGTALDVVYLHLFDNYSRGKAPRIERLCTTTEDGPHRLVVGPYGSDGLELSTLPRGYRDSTLGSMLMVVSERI